MTVKSRLAVVRRALSKARALVEAVETRRLLTIALWDGGGDGVNWTDANNWSGNTLPTAADDVTINVAANPTIILATTGQTINSLNSNEALDIRVSLTVNTTATLSAATSVSNYSTLAVGGNLTTNGLITLGGADSSYGILQIQGGADATLGGTGGIATQGVGTQYIYNYTYDSGTGLGKKLTIGSGIEINASSLVMYSAYPQGVVQNDGPITINGASNSQLGQGNTRFINNGTITFSGGAALQSYNLVNNATKTVNITGSTLNLFGDAAATPFTWDNNGTINADNAIINMAGTFSSADAGTISRTNGGQVNVSGLLDLAGGTLTLDNTKGSWGLASGGRIKNGTITRTGTNTLLARSGVLDNVTLNLPVRVAQSLSLLVENGLTLNDTLTLGDVDNTYGVLQVQGNTDVTIGGTGNIATAGASIEYIYGYGYDSSTGLGKKLTIGSGIEVSASSLYFYAAYSQGAVQIDGPVTLSGVATSQLGQGSTRFINNSTITISGGATVNTYNLLNNATRTVSVAGSTLNLYGDANAIPFTWDNNGSISADNSVVNLSGVFSLADVGSITRTNGGQVNIAGLLDLAGGTLTLDNTRGSWGLASGGRIKNGTVARTGTNELIIRSGTLDNVTLNLPIRVAQYQTLYIDNGLTMNDVMTLGDVDNSYGVLQLQGTTDLTFGGTGSIASAGTSAEYIYNYTYDSSISSARKVTFGSGIEISAASLYLYGPYAGATVQLDGPLTLSGTFTSQLGQGSTRFINNSTLTLSGGATVNSYNLVNNASKTINLNGSTFNLLGDSNATPYSWDNNGTINSTASILNLGGSFALADLGTITRSGVGQVNVVGLLDLGGGTLALDNVRGSWGLSNGGRIKNGTITRTGTNTLIPRGGTADNLILNLPVQIAQYQTLLVENNLTLNDVLTLGDATDNTYGVLQFMGGINQTLGGSGGIVSAGTAAAYISNYIYDSGTGFGRTLTIGANIEITGRSFQMYNAYTNGSLVNNGQLIANDASGNWLIYGTTGNSFTNTNSIQVQAGIVELAQGWTNTGTLSVSGGTLRLSGNFGLSNIGTFARTGGNVHVTGVLDLAGGTLTLDNTRGSWAVAQSGVIKNGTIARTGTNILIGLSGTIDNVVLNLPVTISGTQALYTDHGITINDVITIGAADSSYGQLIAIGSANQTYGGTGSINAIGSNYAYFINQINDAGVGKTLTIGSGIEITGTNAWFYTIYNGGVINNLGTIGSTSGGLFQSTISATSTFTNGGTLLATNGGEVRIYNMSGNAGIVSPGTGSIIDLDGTYTFNQNQTIGNDALLYLRGSWTKNATFDVGGGVVFDYTGASPLNTLYGQIVTGYNGGAWNGTGIMSTRALSNFAFGLGMEEAAVTVGLGGGNFMNRFVDATAVLLRYTRKGDTNVDGDVDFDDLLKLAQNYGGSGKTWRTGDFNYNGVVNFDDLLPLAQNYGLTALSAPARKGGRVNEGLV